MEKEAGGRWSLCSINPGAIWGPPTGSRTDGESVGQVRLAGTSPHPMGRANYDHLLMHLCAHALTEQPC